MLRIKFVVVDRTRSPFLHQGEVFYLKRLKRYARIEWKETRPAKVKKGRTGEDVLDEEGKGILRSLEPKDYVMVLDRAGRVFDSEGLAAHLERLKLRQPSVGFVVGGPLGVSRGVHERAQETLSLSPLTLTHEMTRLLLLEQVYRAFTIIHNEKYHK